MMRKRKGEGVFMKILHYSLGLSPYRSGGMTKYCMDLMAEQIGNGHDVYLLWPGRFGITNNTRLKKGEKTINGTTYEYFEIINPLPVALDQGVLYPELFIKETNRKLYESFLAENQFDMIHIHSLMGIHKEFFIAAKKLNIPVIFTAHDYYPMCPTVTFYKEEDSQVCSSCTGCYNCSAQALSLSKIRFLQSASYRKLKNTALIRQLRFIFRSSYHNFSKADEIKKHIPDQTTVNAYKKLRAYYRSILDSTDLIHFNSTVCQETYKKYIPLKKSVLLPVAHQGIEDFRMHKSFSKPLRMVYLASPYPFKGFNLLIEALDELWQEGFQDFSLTCFSHVGINRPYLHKRGSFASKELPSIFENTDLVVACSLWNETFGFTVAEAICYGVPVLISERMGAKDIVPEGGGIILSPDKDQIKNAIKSCTPHKLSQMNQAILDAPFHFGMKETSKKMEEIYRELIQEKMKNK
jgi:glycosyltransferase involved in cell wall biosynthesis